MPLDARGRTSLGQTPRRFGTYRQAPRLGGTQPDPVPAPWSPEPRASTGCRHPWDTQAGEAPPASSSGEDRPQSVQGGALGTDSKPGKSTRLPRTSGQSECRSSGGRCSQRDGDPAGKDGGDGEAGSAENRDLSLHFSKHPGEAGKRKQAEMTTRAPRKGLGRPKLEGGRV